MTCRYCKWLNVVPDSAGRRVPRKSNVYACDAPIPKRLPVLPASVTGAYGYVSIEEQGRRRRHMEPDDGANCPTFVRL